MKASDIATRRAALGLSLLALAAETGFTSEYLGKVESGEVPVLEHDLQRINEALAYLEKEDAQDRDS